MPFLAKESRLWVGQAKRFASVLHVTLACGEMYAASPISNNSD